MRGAGLGELVLLEDGGEADADGAEGDDDGEGDVYGSAETGEGEAGGEAAGGAGDGHKKIPLGRLVSDDKGNYQVFILRWAFVVWQWDFAGKMLVFDLVYKI